MVKLYKTITSLVDRETNILSVSAKNNDQENRKDLLNDSKPASLIMTCLEALPGAKTSLG